ncbi:MAG: DJ-1 family protein, partial [Sulfurimonas sp.]|nr:DJ-1 family protein [Sulfurimonas sp.]
PTIEEQIRKDGFDETKLVVQDGNIMTSRGPATAICFALQIVKKLKGESVYKDVKGGLLADFCE